MSGRLNQPWLSYERIDTLIYTEPAVVILGLALGAWVGSKLFVHRLSEDRKRNLSEQFKSLGYYLFLGIASFLLYIGLQKLPDSPLPLERFATYQGLFTIIIGAIVFVKVSRLLVLQYLYLSHMKVAFPVLLVNLFTFILSLIIGTWLIAAIFQIRLAPIVATSAVFSIVVGLALQDTLGNLFAGLALQFDKPYEIGDWIEVKSNASQWVGRVDEISWRATRLKSQTHEKITVPNRVISQAEISNFSTQFHPILRSVLFRLPAGVQINEVKKALLSIAKEIPEILQAPPPVVYIMDCAESWIGFKIIYAIGDYGRVFYIGDRVYTEGIQALRKNGFELASYRVTLSYDDKNKSTDSEGAQLGTSDWSMLNTAHTERKLPTD